MAERAHRSRPPEPPDEDTREQPEEGGRKPFLLRLPRELHNDLAAWAADELRSLNAHLEYVLREALRQRNRRR